jgi:hypothetical protein
MRLRFAPLGMTEKAISSQPPRMTQKRLSLFEFKKFTTSQNEMLTFHALSRLSFLNSSKPSARKHFLVSPEGRSTPALSQHQEGKGSEKLPQTPKSER